MSDDGDRPDGGAGDESASALASPPDPPAGGPADSGGGGAGSAADNKPASADPPAGDDADDEDDAALAEMMALQESPPDEDDGALLAEHDPNVAFLGDDGGGGGMGAPNPNADNPAALALRARRRAADEARDRAADRAAARPYLVRKVLGLVPQRYTTLSILAALALFHHTLRTRGQFYLTVVYLQSSKLGYVLMGNALVALAVGAYGALTGFFLGGTRTNEREDVAERIRWDVTETCLALTIFRSELDVVTAVTFIGLVLLKCLHWSCELRGNHIRMTEEVFRYPDEDDADHERYGNTPEENLRLAWYLRLPSARLSHLKFYAFLQLLLFCDILAVAQCALSVATKGPSVDILFGFEAAILLVSALMTQGLYHLHVVDGVMGVFAHLAEGSHHHNAIGELAEASEHGGADEATREGEGAGDRDQAQQQQQQQQQPKSFAKLFVERMANPWRDRRATLSFAIELQAQAAKFLFYVVFFAIVFTYYGMPINIFREVYVSFQQLRRRLIAFNTYRRLTHNMESRFDDIESEEELDRLGRTCIICREQMDLSGGCKKLPCGHAFHTHCLREWLVQQQTCPTCRSDIIAGEKRLKKQREREAAEAAARAEADAAAAEQNVAQTAEVGASAQSTQGASKSEAGELDDGWTSHVDPGSGRTYYFNQSSNVSTWTRPDMPSAAKASDSPPPEAPSARSQGISTPQPEGVRADSKDEARPAATTAGFPCLYRVTCPTGAPVHPDNGLVATRVVPGNKIIVCTSLEYWPPPLEQAMLRMPDGYVRSADVERFLQLGSLRTEGQKQPVAAT